MGLESGGVLPYGWGGYRLRFSYLYLCEYHGDNGDDPDDAESPGGPDPPFRSPDFSLEFYIIDHDDDGGEGELDTCHDCYKE